jgi:hypothetical protein
VKQRGRSITEIKLCYTTLHAFLELKPALYLYNVKYIQQYKIKFEQAKHKRVIAQCANCQRYGHTKNYCHLKLRCMKCTRDHLTNQCHQKKDLVMSHMSSVVEIFLRITRNVQSARTYKRKHIHLSAWLLPHKSKNPIHSTRNSKTKFLCSHKYRARATHEPTS